MGPRDLHAFVDEYGNTSVIVETPGTSQFFILTAVLVQSSDVAAQRAAAEDLRRRFFQSGEMKSSAVAGNDARRIKILQDINTLGVRTYTLVVDKRELDRSSGLAWRGSFFKYLNKRLYERIYRLFENVALLAR